MTTARIGFATEVKSVADSVVSGIWVLRDTEFYRLGRDELLDAGRILEDLGRALYAAQVQWVGEVEDSGAASELGYSSTRVLLRDVLRINTGDAADRVRAARMTQPREPSAAVKSPPSYPGWVPLCTTGKSAPGTSRSSPRPPPDGRSRSTPAPATTWNRSWWTRPVRSTPPSPGRSRNSSNRSSTLTAPCPRTGNPRTGWSSGSGTVAHRPGSPRSPGPSPTRPSKPSAKPPTPSPARRHPRRGSRTTDPRQTGSPMPTTKCSGRTWTPATDPAMVVRFRTSRCTSTTTPSPGNCPGRP